MPTLSHLRSLQALELVVRLRSMKAAAEALSISPAAVGQRVKALEDYLGLELVVRGRSGLQPTASLEAAWPHLSAGFRELEAAAGALDLQRAQEIHVAAAPDVADLWLRPRLAAFQGQHPNVRFCVNGEGEAALRLEKPDCEISFGPLAPDADLLFADQVLPLCSAEIAARIAALPAGCGLEGFPLLHLDFYKDDPAVPDWPRWLAVAGQSREAPERGIRFQRIVHALDAVRANAGVTLCGAALLLEALAEGRLSAPFPASATARTSHVFQARFRTGRLVRPVIGRFRAWLLDEAAATAERLEAAVG